MKPKISFVIGNANQGYMIKMCIYSFMKFNKDNVDEIIISDNSSTDYSEKFYEENIYKNITKIIKYDIPRDRDPKAFYPHGYQWDLGLNNCKNKYVVLSHADLEWKGNYTKFFIDKYYKENPFIFGYGGGDGTKRHHRIHEWGMIINKDEWLDFGVSFEGKFTEDGAYDTSAYLYKKAIEANKKIIPLDYTKADNNEYFSHFVAGGKYRKEEITSIAKGWLKNNGYWN